MFERIAAGCRYLAFTLLGVIALVLVLNAGAYAFLRYLKYFQARSAELPIVATYGERLKAGYPGWDSADLNDLLYETWARPFVYQSITQFTEAPIDGRFVTVDEAGFRHIKDQAPWPPEKEALSVFVFGGSTAFGYGVRDEETIASFLQERLRGATERKVAVYNFGRGFYYSSQELLLFLRLLQRGAVPDVAVFIDGFNDIHAAAAQDLPMTPTLLQSQSRVLGDIAWTFWQATPLAKAMERLQGFTQRAGRAEKSAGAPLPDGDTGPEMTGPWDVVLTRYQRNRVMIEALAAGFEVTPLFVLQPVPGYRYDSDKNPFYQGEQQDKDLYAKGIAAFDEAALAGKLGDRFISCADVQEGRDELLYVDNIHYAAPLADLVAACIIKRGDVGAWESRK